ncbi:MAG: mechanosensitive ion channel [Bacteroidales bacterium]|jgi:small conductance mechanosensitive channel
MEFTDLGSIIELLKEFAVSYGLKLIGAVVALIVGLWIIKIITKGFARLMDKKDVSVSLRSFLKTGLHITLKVLLAVSIATMVGVPMTSFVAILAAAGLAVGLALSGTLQNFAGGVIILLLKPFKVGDFVEAQGYMGTVKEIQIFHTFMLTVDNKTIIIPNGPLSSGSLTNFSREPLRRVDLTIGISYGSSYEKAREVVSALIREDERILPEPAPFIGLHKLADSSINVVTRLWVNAENYWDVYFDMNDKIYKTFPDQGLSFPFPQMDVHLKRE